MLVKTSECCVHAINCLSLFTGYIGNDLFFLRERDVAPWKERSLMVQWVVGSNLHGVDPLSYFSFQPVLHDWCNKGCGMCYPVCWMVHIKEPLLLIGKSSLCGGSRFPFSLSEWSLTICLTPYITINKNVLSVSLNKTFPSFLILFSYFSDQS